MAIAIAVLAASGSSRIAAAAGGASQPVTIKLTHQLGKPGDPEFAVGGIPLSLSPAPPAGDWKLPDFKNRKPLYASITVSGKAHLIVFDRAPETNAVVDDIMSSFTGEADNQASFYNRAYFDADADGSLLNDPPVAGIIVASYGATKATFPSFEITAKLAGTDGPYRFAVTLSTRDNPGQRASVEQSTSAKIITLCMLKGTFSSGAQSYFIGLWDGNADGAFTTPTKDVISVVNDRFLDPSAAVPLQGVLGIGAGTFRLAPRNDDPRLLILTPIDPTSSGTLKLSSQPERLQLKASQPGNNAVLFHPAAQVPLPPSSYELTGYVISRDDTNGNRWVVSGGKVPGIEVAGGGTSKLIFGEPLSSAVTFQGVGSTVRMGVANRGAGNESISGVSYIPAGRLKLPPHLRDPIDVAPSFTIVDKTGKTISRGKFEFG